VAVTSADQPLRRQTAAGLRVVDALVRVLSVNPNPAFIETGAGSTSLSANISNVANWRMRGTAAVQVIAPNGAVLLNNTLPVTLALGNALLLPLGNFNAASLAAGIYTVSLSIAIQEPASLAGLETATGYGLLTVGQGIKVYGSAQPAIIAPGDSVVTTSITSERTIFDGGGGAGEGAPILTQTLVVSSIANAGNNNPAVGVPLAMDGGTYDVVIDDGAYRFGVPGNEAGFWYSAIRASVFFTSTAAREYWLGYGLDNYNGTTFYNAGSPTQAEAIALNRASLCACICRNPPPCASGLTTPTPRTTPVR
ncbi:MAG: hypothetical protein HC853_14950, partial [Anaerolineae bacterium]|nr:hypothetical protein [Anaerolineae bacterium]